MLNYAPLLLFGLLAILLGWVALEGINRRPLIGAVACFALLSLLVFFTEQPEYFARAIGGVNVAVQDVVCGLLGLIAVLRLLQGRGGLHPSMMLWLGIFTAMLLLSYFRGLGSFGLQHATNEFREFFYFLSALAFALSFPVRRMAERMPWVAVVGGAMLVVVALLRMPRMAGFGLDERTIPSYAALAIGEAFFLGWCWLRAGGVAKTRWLIFGFLPFSFLMLHRSVWVALAIGLLIILIVDRQERARLLGTLVVGTAAAAAVVALFFREAVAGGFDTAVKEATSSEKSTFLWRIEGWVALLRNEGSGEVIGWFIGQPMGSGYARVLGDSVLNTPEIESGVIPHNYYVSVLLRGGVIGLIAFIAMYAQLFRALRVRARALPDDPYAPCFIVIIAMQLTYFVPYSADMIQGLLLGSALVLARPFERESLS